MRLVSGHVIVSKFESDHAARLGHEGKLRLLAVRGDAEKVYALENTCHYRRREEARSS